MKHLLDWKTFENINSKEDLPDVKKAKDETKQKEDKLKDYKLIRSKIESLFNSDKDISQIEKSVEDILSDIPDGESDLINKFVKIMRLKKKIEFSKDQSAEDKERLSQYSKNKSDPEISDKIVDMNNKKKIFNKEFDNLKKEFNQLTKSHELEVSNISSEVKKNKSELGI